MIALTLARALSAVAGAGMILVASLSALTLWNMAHPSSLGVALVAAAREGRRAKLTRRRRRTVAAVQCVSIAALAVCGVVLVLP